MNTVQDLSCFTSTIVITEFPADALLTEGKFLHREHTLPPLVGDSFIHSFIHSVVCLTTGSWFLPKRVPHRVRSSASFLNFQ
jgi:hypothetical protein